MTGATRIDEHPEALWRCVTTRPRAESVPIRGYGTPGAATATTSRSPFSIFVNNDTRPTFAIAAPVRGR